MSSFAVTVEQIAHVWPHPNADRLDMARLSSMTYQFVIAKNGYQAGDLVVYFPIDSLLPAEVVEKLGLTGKLSGREQNRVKTVRLRGEISQGIVIAPDAILESGFADLYIGQNLTDVLGVTKYEPPVINNQDGNLVRLPELVGVYDVENAERYQAAVEAYLMDQPVYISEKVEGSHFAASILADGKVVVSQRNYAIDPVPNKLHTWHKVAQQFQLESVLPALKAQLGGQVVTLRGEVLGPGVQGNLYQLKDHTIRFFEVEVDGSPLDASTFLAIADQYQLPTVPVISVGVRLRDWLAGQTLAQASDGPSALLESQLREGVVIRPLQEAEAPTLGRVILKQRSPAYLATSDF